MAHQFVNVDVSPQQMEPNVGTSLRETAYGSTLTTTNTSSVARIFKELKPLYLELMGEYMTEAEIAKMCMEEAMK